MTTMNEIDQEMERLKRAVDSIKRLEKVIGHTSRFQRELEEVLKELETAKNHISVIEDVILEGCE